MYLRCRLLLLLLTIKPLGLLAIALNLFRIRYLELGISGGFRVLTALVFLGIASVSHHGYSFAGKYA